MSKRLFETHPINRPQIARLVRESWSVELGDLIKPSQNYTFHATNADGDKVIVRVTPDPADEEGGRIEDELHFINYCRDNGLRYVCGPIATDASKSNEAEEYLISESGVHVVVFEHARGELIDFISWKWLSDEPFARDWGRWTGDFHAVSRKYAKQFPERVKRARGWDQLHDSILSGSSIDPRDAALVTDPKHYGLLHGDINISNLFYLRGERTLCVFDWDQVQTGWYLYDLVMCFYFPWMLARAGHFLDGSKAPSLETAERFKEWIVAGYEAGLDAGEPSEAPHRVDRDALDRMVLLRKEFYERFCRRALKELDEDEANGAEPKPGMRVFMEWVVNWLDREAAVQAAN